MSDLTIVTGGNGFVGAHLTRALLAAGQAVRVLDIDERGVVPEAEYARVDITNQDAVREALQGARTVFHNASMVHTKRNREDLIWRVNHGGTRNVMEACREHQVPQLIYVSSGSVVYEGHDIENGDESLPYASTSQAPYADSKIQAEKEVLAAHGKGGVATCALRPHVIFGPGDRRFMPALLEHARAGRLKFQVGRGRWLSDYTYVDNLVDALLLAQEKLSVDSPVGGRPYFITNGEPLPFWDFVKRVLERLGLPPVRYKLPHRLVYGIAAVKEGIDTLKGGTLNAEDGLTRFAIRYMCTHHYFSIERARRELGYNPKVSVAEGIERTCADLERGEAA